MQVELVGNEGHPCAERCTDIYTELMIILRTCTGRKGAQMDYRVIQTMFMNRMGQSCDEKGKRSCA